MLELSHGTTSVCSAKVRIGLSEKGLEWHSHPINLTEGEQHRPEYLRLNPKGVVPTLVDGGLVVVESSVILEYIDDLGTGPRLMPKNPQDSARARMWLARCIDVHAAINTMTFSTVGRSRIRAAKTPEEVEAAILRMPNPAARAKRRDLFNLGLESPHVDTAFFILRSLFHDMQTILDRGPWLLGTRYSLADVALVSYVDRLDRLGFSGLWDGNAPQVGRWLTASRERQSYKKGILDYAGDVETDKMRTAGAPFWPDVQYRWDKVLNL